MTRKAFQVLGAKGKSTDNKAKVKAKAKFVNKDLFAAETCFS